jgi:ABC-2 type transport system ATP-binding protein
MEVHTHDASDLPDVVHALVQLGTAEPVVDAPTRRVSVTVDHGGARLRAATQALDDAGIAFDDIALRRPTLDEVFLSLTGTSIAPEAANDLTERKSA